MHLFWYNSPVRFYRNPSDLDDMTNPQNTQYFGEFNPYVLEKDVFHRFLIPQYNNVADSNGYSIWLKNAKSEIQLFGVCNISDGKINYVTFKHNEEISGNLQIRDLDNNIIYTSNCVKFADTSDDKGRKYLRIASRHNFNRNLFNYEDRNAWFVTNIPAYCLGMVGMDAEISNYRFGGSNSLRTKESYLDETVQYQFLSNGDANVLNFIQSLVVNQHFFIDGTKRTSLQKLDGDDFSMSGKLEFVNVKSKLGTNILIDEDEIFSDLELDIISLSPIDNYSNKANLFSGEIYIEFNAPISFTSDSTKKIKVFKDGVLFVEKNKTQLSISGNKLIINNSALGVGNYYIFIDAGIVENSIGNKNETIADSSVWNFSLVQDYILSTNISWEDNTNTDKSGSLTSISVYQTAISENPNDPFTSGYWEKWNGTEFIFDGNHNSNSYQFGVSNGVNKFRLTLITQSGVEVKSNILQYTSNAVPTYPTHNYWYKSRHSDGRIGLVTYLDEFGIEQTHALSSGEWAEDGMGGQIWVEARCELIRASSIVEVVYAMTCTP